MSLSGRLSLLVGLIVLGVAASVTYLETRIYQRDIDRDLLSAARLGAQSAADTLAARPQPLDPLDVRDMLHDLVDADPLIDAISVVTADEASGQLRVLTSTSTEERAEVIEAARRAIDTGVTSSQRGTTVTIEAVPVPRFAGTAVVATVGLETLIQTRQHALRVALGFALPTVLLVTLLVHLAVRQFVGRPLRVLLQTMETTARGDWRTRAAIARPDELGTIAAGLNRMLDDLEGLHRTLQERVDAATADLSLRNAQLAASHEELFAARESLAHAERVAALGQVAATVAHQAGTPLNLVSGYVQMLRDDPATDERVRSRLQTVDRQIQQVARVLRAMLDSARPPAGFDTVSISDIVERVGELAQPRLSRSQIRLKTVMSDRLPAIQADVTQLEMALLNLVNNALDAMPNGGTLSLTATPGPLGVRVQVSDTGPGIAPGILDRLFIPWVSTKPSGQGSGLGLAIVHDVVRAHGGSVSAHNGEVGAVFIIDLPEAGASSSVA